MGRYERIFLAAVLAAGLALRLLYLYEQRADVLFDHPVLDEQRYLEAARALVSGGVSEDRPFWQPPGIIFVLAATGGTVIAPRVIQSLLSTAACLLLFLIARRLFTTRVALAACAICALHGVLLFESYELLPPTYIWFFDLLALWLLLDERRSPARAFFAGLTLGVSALFSPTVLPFVPLAAVQLRRAPLMVALLAGVLLPIVPVTARNWSHGHEFVLISTNGGLNFFLGNNDRAEDTLALRPGRRWDELVTEPPRHGIFLQGAASAYFTRKGLAFWRAQPARALRQYARKLFVVYFNGAEIPRDTDLGAAREQSWILRALVFPQFPDGILIPLGLLGIGLVWRERRRWWLCAGFLLLQALVISAFFVTSRHRVPSLPMFALFAAAGVAELVRRRHSRRTMILASLALVQLLAFCNVPIHEAAVSFAAERDFYRGLAAPDPRSAIEYFQRAAARDPFDARPWTELGNALAAAGRSDEAIAAWQHAAADDSWDSRPRRRISMLRARAGDLDGAMVALQDNIEAAQHDAAHYAPDWLNLAFLRAQRGQAELAIEALHSAERADPSYFRANVQRMAETLEPAQRRALGL